MPATELSNRTQSPSQSQPVQVVITPPQRVTSNVREQVVVSSEMSVKDLCDALEKLAQNSEGRSHEAIQREINSLIQKAQLSPKVAQSMNRMGDEIFRDHMQALFSSSYEAAHGSPPPDGLNSFQRAVRWCDNAIHTVKDGIIRGLEIKAKIDQWVMEGLVKAGQWIIDPENWKRLGQQIASVAVKIWEGVQAAAVQFYETVKTTLTDPKKRAEFFRKLVTGELYLDFGKAVLNTAGELLSALSETIGLTDLGRATVAILSGDTEAAKEHLGHAWGHFSNAVGIADIVKFSELTIRAIEEDNPQLFYEGLTHLARGGAMLAITVVSAGEGAALIQSARAAVITFSYRGVAVAAEGLAAKELARIGSSRVMSVMAREELEFIGENAAIKVGQRAESALAKEVDDIAGKGAYNRASTGAENAKLDSGVAEKVEAHLSDPEVRGRIVEETRSAANDAGREAADEVMETSIKRLKDKDPEKFMARNRKDLKLEVRKMSKDEIISIVRSASPEMTEAELARTAKAFEHISKGTWRFTKETNKKFADDFAQEFTDRLMKEGLGDGFDRKWALELERMQKTLEKMGVKMPDELVSEMDDAAKNGFRKGFKDRVSELVKKKEKPKKLRRRKAATDESDTPVENAQNKGKGDVFDAQENKESNYTIEANSFNPLKQERFRGRRNEDVLDEVRADETRRQREKSSKPSDEQATKSSRSESSQQREIVGTK